MTTVRFRGCIAPLCAAFVVALMPPAGWSQTPGIEIATTFKGHSEPVYTVALTPDAKHLVTGSFDNSVKVWDVATGNLVKAFEGPTAHTKMVLSVAISNDGTMIASGGVDGAFKFWDVPLKIPPRNDPVPRIALIVGSPRYLAPYNLAGFVLTAEKLGLIRSLTANTIKPLSHPVSVDCIAFHPKNPAIVATGGHDGHIRIYDLGKSVLVKEILAHVDKNQVNPIYTIAFSPDGGQILTSSYDRTLKLHDSTSGALVREFKKRHEKDFPKGHTEEIYAADFSPDGKFIASGSGGLENVVKIWKTDDGSVVRDLVNPSLPGEVKPSHPGWIYHVRFLKDGRLVSLGDAPKNRGYIAVWNADGKLLHGEMTPFGSIYGLAISADEKTFAVGAGNRGRGKGDFNNAYLLRVPGVNK